MQKVYQDGDFYQMANIAEKYFVAKNMELGNYATFSEVFISTGHDAQQVKDYSRELVSSR